MIRERPDVAAKRDECRLALRALKEAVSALESLPADLISRINGAPPVVLPSNGACEMLLPALQRSRGTLP
jgi:hypothetical protein